MGVDSLHCRMTLGIRTWTLSLALLVSATMPLAAQHIGAHSDADSARIDAMFGAPNRYGAVPQDNLFATTPGLEQQARPQFFTFNGLVPLFFNSNPQELNPAFGGRTKQATVATAISHSC